MQSQTYLAVASIVSLVGYFLYRSLLPKIIPGVPYKSATAKGLLGDIPDALRWNGEHHELFSFLSDRLRELDSPVAQVFLRLGGKPWIVVADYREAQDILTKRTREFDRATLFGDLISGLGPNHHAHMDTNDEWRAHRKLIADCMSTSFLENVAAPQIYSVALDTLALWSEKMRLAQDSPFTVRNDINSGALDTMWAVSFGSEIGTARAQTKLLSGIDRLPNPGSKDAAIDIPAAPNPKTFDALLTLTNSCTIPLSSPIPRLHHRLALRWMPSLAAAVKLKNSLVREELDKAWAKYSKGDSTATKSALELIVEREVIMSRKEGRDPQYDTPAIQDELFGFVVAGYDTTSSTLCWALKYLTGYPAVQTKLRNVFRQTFAQAHADGRLPSVEEISKAHMPYFEAAIHEIHRCGNVLATGARRTLVDTLVLGHVIPKDTDVLLLTNGADYLKPAFAVDEKIRSTSSQENKARVGVWDQATIGTFDPERWLTKDEGGNLVFNASAGPAHPFGAGPRGCYGRKLASLTLRIDLTLMIWQFELQSLPEELGSFKGEDKLTHEPQLMYLRLAKAL